MADVVAALHHVVADVALTERVKHVVDQLTTHHLAQDFGIRDVAQGVLRTAIPLAPLHAAALAAFDVESVLARDVNAKFRNGFFFAAARASLFAIVHVITVFDVRKWQHGHCCTMLLEKSFARIGYCALLVTKKRHLGGKIFPPWWQIFSTSVEKFCHAGVVFLSRRMRKTRSSTYLFLEPFGAPATLRQLHRLCPRQKTRLQWRVQVAFGSTE